MLPIRPNKITGFKKCNLHKILIFFPNRLLKSLCGDRIDELTDSNEPAIKRHYYVLENATANMVNIVTNTLQQLIVACLLTSGSRGGPRDPGPPRPQVLRPQN